MEFHDILIPGSLFLSPYFPFLSRLESVSVSCHIGRHIHDGWFRPIPAIDNSPPLLVRVSRHASSVIISLCCFNVHATTRFRPPQGRSTNTSATLQCGDHFGDEDRRTENLKGKRILKRMVSWGGTSTGDDALIRNGHHQESDAERKAKTSFFPPRRLFSTSFNRSFRRQKSGASVAAVTEEEDEAFHYDPYSSYGRSAGDGGDSHHGDSASDVEISEMSGRYDASPRDSSSTVAV